LKTFDLRGLLGGQDSGADCVDPDLGGDCACGAFVIAREQNRSEAECFQLGDRLGGAGLQCVGERE